MRIKRRLQYNIKGGLPFSAFVGVQTIASNLLLLYIIYLRFWSSTKSMEHGENIFIIEGKPAKYNKQQESFHDNNK